MKMRNRRHNWYNQFTYCNGRIWVVVNTAMIGFAIPGKLPS